MKLLVNKQFEFKLIDKYQCVNTVKIECTTIAQAWLGLFQFYPMSDVIKAELLNP